MKITILSDIRGVTGDFTLTLYVETPRLVAGTKPVTLA
jgi:hypothetical protein